jgi:hypothetical protein
MAIEMREQKRKADQGKLFGPGSDGFGGELHTLTRKKTLIEMALARAA